MKIVIAPDSYKGTLSSAEVAQIISDSVKCELPNAETVLLPIADGGEGTVDSLGCKKVNVTVSGPYFENIDAYYGVYVGKAVVEMAVCAGLPLVKNNPDPSKTTTYGVGQLIKHAVESGIKNITVALGGSCTNDFGCGMAAALGVKFFGTDGKEFVPVGGTMKDISRIDVSEAKDFLSGCEISAMCDVTNPLFGPKGCARIFARQKGADDTMIESLESGIIHASEIVKRDLGIDVDNLPGSGAAGGTGGGVTAFLGGKLIRGIEAVLAITGFDDKLDGASLVITGEGRFDSQSLDGKCVSGVAEHASKAGVPCVVIAGSVENGVRLPERITAVFSIQSSPVVKEIAFRRTRVLLGDCVRNVIRLFARSSKEL